MLTKIRQTITNKNGGCEGGCGGKCNCFLMDFFSDVCKGVLAGYIFIGAVSVVIVLFKVYVQYEQPRFLRPEPEIKLVEAIKNLGDLEIAIKQYKADCGEYPATLSLLKKVKPATKTPVTPTDKGPWLKEPTIAIIDPWGTAWIYNSKTGSIKSAGADKTEGTVDDVKYSY